MTRLRLEPSQLPLAFVALALSAHAQQGEGAGGGAIQPRIAVSQAWTDNLRLTEQDKDAALITTVSPGVRIERNTGSLRASLDYTLNGIVYLKSGQASHVQNSLTAGAQAEIVPQTFYIDAQANIGRQNGSAFGLQTPSGGGQGQASSLDNPNQHETGTLSVSPQLRGQLGGLANFSLRGNASITEVRGSSLGDSRGSGLNFTLSQLTPGVIGWFAQANSQQTRSVGAVSNKSSTVAVGLNYRPDPDWAFSANAGSERHNYLSAGGGSQDGVTGGVTAEWTPTPRTRASGNWQRHQYGDSRGFNLEHRMVHTVWRLSDSRTVTLGNTGSSGGLRTNYDLYYLLLASTEPDPIKRDALVRLTLLSLGLSPDAPLAQGFLSTGPSQLHAQMFSFTLQGVRSNVTASLNRSVTTRLGSDLNQGDLANNGLIDQRSYSLSGSYQLSPASGLTLTASRQETLGDAGMHRTQLTSLMANLNTKLGARFSAQIGARHSRFDGVTSYSENAAYANLTQQF